MESKNYQNEPRFNGVYFRDHLPEKKDDTYVINIDEYYDIGTQWIALYALSNVTYFGNFGVEHIPKKIIGNKSTHANRPSQIACTVMTVHMHITCTQTASRIRIYLCIVLILLCKNNLNLSISHTGHYALRK